MSFTFEIHASSGQARTGTFFTPHGKVETPAFMPVCTLATVKSLDPDDLTALGRLDVLYQTAGNYQELLSVLQHEAELTGDPAEAVSFQYRIAELYEKHLNDVDRSVELYREILNIQSDHTPTLNALGVEWSITGDDNRNASVAVSFRARGENEWRGPE